jgi:hypothetical protein
VCLDTSIASSSFLNLAFDKLPGVFPSVRENLSVLTSRAGFMASTPFSPKPGKHHPNGGHVLFNRGRRSLALKHFNVSGDRNGFNAPRAFLNNP